MNLSRSVISGQVNFDDDVKYQLKYKKQKSSIPNISKSTEKIIDLPKMKGVKM